MNWRAVKWAYEQDGLNVTQKAVLISYAVHADAKGYSWPGVELIASTWGMDRRTVRRAINALLSSFKLRPTKKTRGWTGQVKVYRMPKITYESGAKFPRFENAESGDKAGIKRGQSGAKLSREHDNDRTTNKSDHDSRVRSRAPAVAPSIPESDFVAGYQNHNQPAQGHIKWPEFAEYCRGKGGTPSENGFWSWLGKQKPHWRNKVRQRFDGEEGYELDGKFFTQTEANELAAKEPELIEKFRKARKRDGKIEIVSPN